MVKDMTDRTIHFFVISYCCSTHALIVLVHGKKLACPVANPALPDHLLRVSHSIKQQPPACLLKASTNGFEQIFVHKFARNHRLSRPGNARAQQFLKNTGRISLRRLSLNSKQMFWLSLLYKCPRQRIVRPLLSRNKSPRACA